MRHFNWKSLAFYGGAIAVVIVLFKAVTAYGNANLKAPLAIGGDYRLDAQTLPGCLKSDALLLHIQQSGIYLNGSLRSADGNTQLATAAQEKPSLTGQMNVDQLNLVGSVPFVRSCKNVAQQSDASPHPLSVKIQGVVNGETLTGQIALSSVPTAAEFTAQREAQKEKQQE